MTFFFSRSIVCFASEWVLDFVNKQKKIWNYESRKELASERCLRTHTNHFHLVIHDEKFMEKHTKCTEKINIGEKIYHDMTQEFMFRCRCRCRSLLFYFLELCSPVIRVVKYFFNQTILFHIDNRQIVFGYWNCINGFIVIVAGLYIFFGWFIA